MNLMGMRRRVETLLLGSLVGCGVFQEPTLPAFSGQLTINPPGTTSMFVGQEQQLSAIVLEANHSPAYRTVTWTSSDPNVARFTPISTYAERVTLTALKPGTVKVFAAVGEPIDSLSITVRTPGPVARVTVPTSLSMMAGTAYQLAPVLRDSDGVALAGNVDFASSDPSVAVVSPVGRVTSVRRGSKPTPSTGRGR